MTQVTKYDSEKAAEYLEGLSYLPVSAKRRQEYIQRYIAEAREKGVAEEKEVSLRQAKELRSALDRMKEGTGGDPHGPSSSFLALPFLLGEIWQRHVEAPKTWQPGSLMDQLFLATSAAGELGEALNIVKKYARDDRLDLDHLKEEMGDTYVLLSLLGRCYGLTIPECIQHVMPKIRKRCPLPEEST